jgi:hypothetical protein
MHEVDRGEVAARIEFDPTSHGTPLSFLPPPDYVVPVCNQLE